MDRKPLASENVNLFKSKDQSRSFVMTNYCQFLMSPLDSESQQCPLLNWYKKKPLTQLIWFIFENNIGTVYGYLQNNLSRTEILILNKKKISSCDLAVKSSYMIHIITHHSCNPDTTIMRLVPYALCSHLLSLSYTYMLGGGVSHGLL